MCQGLHLHFIGMRLLFLWVAAALFLAPLSG